MADAITVAFDRELLARAMATASARAILAVEAVSLDTATRVADAMRARIARSAGPWRHGDVPTHTQVHYEKARGGRGYVVMAYDSGGKGAGGRTRQHHVDIYLERGTRHMPAQPFIDASARVEEGPHFRRMQEAVINALDEGVR